MTLYLMALRASIILGVSVVLMPVEIVFDAVESELTRRGVPL